jgi:prepilin-type N-terminal cleavage/methylation domain-containing protein
MSSSMKDDGFSLIEISIVLIIIGLLTTFIMKAGTIIETCQLRSLVKNVDGYRIATHLFTEKYGYLPGDYPKAREILGAYLKNGNGNRHIEGAGMDKGGEAFWFWQHLGAAGLIPHPGILTPHELPGFGHGLPKSAIGGGLTVVENPARSMPGLWILLGEDNGLLNNRAVLTPHQAQQILDLYGEGDPLHGLVRIQEGVDVPPQSCIRSGRLALGYENPSCIVYFKI